jgi:hypothetical protein
LDWHETFHQLSSEKNNNVTNLGRNGSRLLPVPGYFRPGGREFKALEEKLPRLLFSTANSESCDTQTKKSDPPIPPCLEMQFL